MCLRRPAGSAAAHVALAESTQADFGPVVHQLPCPRRLDVGAQVVVVLRRTPWEGETRSSVVCRVYSRPARCEKRAFDQADREPWIESATSP